MVQFAVMALAFSAPCDASQYVATGDPVPCDGVLVPIETAERVRDNLEGCNADLVACSAHREIDRDEWSAQVEALTVRAEAAEVALDDTKASALELSQPRDIARPWHEHPVFVVASTLACVAVVIGAAVGGFKIAEGGI